MSRRRYRQSDRRRAHTLSTASACPTRTVAGDHRYVPVSTVYYWLSQEGVVRSRSQAFRLRARRLRERTWLEALRLRQEGMTYEDIARRLGVRRRQTVAQYIRQAERLLALNPTHDEME
ncbi:MAG: hypothetical protein KatS3mg051_1904 [Anaerolineae bacterium]|nr:MAG: hypothetical protein KatS3mg051_1904 [Anaerolineae bacterium]